MKKLRLRIEDVRVSSFPIETPAGERGTVRGHAKREYTCEGLVCYPVEPTVYQTCIVNSCTRVPCDSVGCQTNEVTCWPTDVHELCEDPTAATG